MPTRYDNLGVRFQYPENWELISERGGFYPHEVSLASPGTAMWTLNIYDAITAPEDVLDEVLSVLQGEFGEIESDRVDGEIEGVPIQRDEIDFFLREKIVHCESTVLQLGGRTLLILCQAEDREFAELAPVFHAMAASMIREAAKE